MMHLEAIKRRNANPAPQPTRRQTNEYAHAAMIQQQARNNPFATLNAVRPWDAPDPLSEAEAHPR